MGFLLPNDLAPRELLVPALAIVAGVIVLAYCVHRARSGSEDFGLFDAALVVVAMGALPAAAIPIIAAFRQRAETAVLYQNLSTLRTQIERYKLDHGGSAPLLYKGTFPQLIHATDAAGVPGNPGKRYRYGPYLPSGIPPTPQTGQPVVAGVEPVPPAEPPGNGGWIYHQPTGRIAPDLGGFLTQ